MNPATKEVENNKEELEMMTGYRHQQYEFQRDMGSDYITMILGTLTADESVDLSNPYAV